MNMDYEKYPIIPAIPVNTAGNYGISHRILCPYCGEIHFHGIGSGHRISHCITKTENSDNGYILIEPKNKSIDKNVSKQIIDQQNSISYEMKRIVKKLYGESSIRKYEKNNYELYLRLYNTLVTMTKEANDCALGVLLQLYSIDIEFKDDEYVNNYLQNIKHIYTISNTNMEE
jgi:hypothetical protein